MSICKPVHPLPSPPIPPSQQTILAKGKWLQKIKGFENGKGGDAWEDMQNVPRL